MLLPTSGSSGLPKLTIVTNRMLLQQVNVPQTGVLQVCYAFEPLKQSLDGMLVISISYFCLTRAVLSKGGRIGVYSGLERITEDCQLLSPTGANAIPLLL
jgi:hypothetical protein